MSRSPSNPVTESRNSAESASRAVASRTARVRLSSTDDGNASSSRRVIDASALSAASRIAASASATVAHRCCPSRHSSVVCVVCVVCVVRSPTPPRRRGLDFRNRHLPVPCPPLTRAALDPRRSATSRKNRVASVSVQQYARWNVGIVICVPLAFAFANNSPYVMWRTSKRESRSDKPGHSFRNARGGKGAFDAFEAVAARVAVVDRFGSVSFCFSSHGASPHITVSTRVSASFGAVERVGIANEDTRGARPRRGPVAVPVRLGNAHGATVVIIGLFEPGVPIFPRGASAPFSAEARPTPPGRPSGAADAAAVLDRSPTASSPSPCAVGSDISASPLVVASGVETTTQTSSRASATQLRSTP